MAKVVTEYRFLLAASSEKGVMSTLPNYPIPLKGGMILRDPKTAAAPQIIGSQSNSILARRG